MTLAAATGASAVLQDDGGGRTIANAVVLSGTGTDNINAVSAANSLTLTGIISGPGGLTKGYTAVTTTQVAGPGNLVISSPALFTGSVTVNQGTLTLSGGGSLLAQGSSNTYTVNAGGVLTLDNTGTNNSNRLGNGAGNTLTLNGEQPSTCSATPAPPPARRSARSRSAPAVRSSAPRRAAPRLRPSRSPASRRAGHRSYRLIRGHWRSTGGRGQRQPDRVRDAPAHVDHDGRQ